jgi:hypothetical protein
VKRYSDFAINANRSSRRPAAYSALKAACVPLKYSNFPPKIHQVFEVGNLVFLDGVPQARQPFFAHGGADICLRDDRDQDRDGAAK